MTKFVQNRIVILKKKLESKAINVPEDVIQFIAQNVKTDDLEEALVHIVVYALVVESPITLALALKALESPKYFVSIGRPFKKKVVKDIGKHKNIQKGYRPHLN